MSPAEILTAVNMIVGMAAMPAGEVRPERIESIHDVGLMIVSCLSPVCGLHECRDPRTALDARARMES